MADRSTRDQVSREKSVRSVYTPASALPDPTPQPGWAFRWIATSILGQADPTNVSKKMREGWVPCKLEDHPELMLGSSGNVEVGGLMLCKIAQEQADARDAYYSRQAQAQMESVDNHFMQQNDARMPLFAERKSSTTRGGFGSGSK